jgi:NADH-quinone oxidoreductase subunit M
MPAMTFLLALFTMASVGLPGLNGFVGEFLILVGMFQVAAVRDPVSGTIPVAGWFYAAVTAGGILLGAWYMFSLLRKLVFGAERFPAGTRAPDFGLREWLILALPAALCVIIGVYPKPFLRPIENSAEGLLEAVRRGGVEVVRRSPAAPPTRGIRTGPTGPTTTGPAGH